MKKWVVTILMTLSFLDNSFAQNRIKNIIVQQGANLPITELTLFVPLGTALLDKTGGETALLKKIIAQSTLGAIIEKHGGGYSINISLDAFNFQITLLNEEVYSFLKEFIPAIQSFTIEDKDINLAKKQLLEDIQSLNSNPNRKSYSLFIEKIFANHPYGRSKIGTKEGIPKITKEDIVSVWNHLFKNQENLYFILASNNPEEFQTSLVNIWESFPHTSEKINSLPDISLFKKTEHWESKDPSLSQSFINVGFLLPPTEIQQKHLMMMFQEIVGGGFNSRLFKILRAQHGLSYSPHAIYSSSVKGDVFDILFSTKIASTKESLRVIHDILEDIEKNGITDEEFETTKKLVHNSILRLGEDNASLNQLVANDILYTRPLGSIKTLEQQIRNSSKEELNTFIKKILKTYPSVTFILGGS